MKNQWGAVLVSVLVLVIFQFAIGIAWWTNNVSLPVLLGMAGTNAGTAVGFWLGSSAGSQKKDETIAASSSKSTGAPPP